MSRSQFNFYYSFRVRYSEVDAQGIVFNAHYLITPLMSSLKNFTSQTQFLGISTYRPSGDVFALTLNRMSEWLPPAFSVILTLVTSTIPSTSFKTL